jgi:hypothetical protein
MIQATRTNTPTRPRMNRLNPGLLSQIQMPLPLASIEHSSPKFKCSAAPCPISLAPPLSPFYAPLRPVPPLPGPSPNGAGCAIPRSSGEQGNCAGSRGAWPRSPFAYPRTGNGGRRRPLSPPRGRWPPPLSVRAADQARFGCSRIRPGGTLQSSLGAVRACHIVAPSVSGDDASATGTPPTSLHTGASPAGVAPPSIDSITMA